MMDCTVSSTTSSPTNELSQTGATEDSDEDSSGHEVFPGYSSMADFTQAGFGAVMEATRSSSNLPNGISWDLYSSYPVFHRIMEAEGNRILELISMALHHQGISGSILRRDFEEKFDMIVDANDVILERVGCNLDELAGIRRNPETVVVENVGNTTRVVSGSWNRSAQESPNTLNTSLNSQQTVRLLTAKNIQRPQAKFKDKIDNSSSPFLPRIKEKPNSLKPLSTLLEVTEAGESFSHPYEYELELFNPPERQLKKVEPRLYLPLAETPVVMISQPEDVAVLVADIKKYSEIAIDLEHHSYRTFQGITCLMQISTRDTDYLIDTLELRDKLHVLNEVFTDPKIVKVFHGADSDVEWLQRDLCLYVVNMFDTHQAAKLLKFAHLSLAFLLKHYCNITVNKHFQLADWRIRPLPQELTNYAREDTHYLLYIYDVMKNTLLDTANNKTNLLMSVIRQSTELCKRRYEKPILREDSHMDLYKRNKKMFDNRQLYAFRELFRWRDKTAREEDESLGYVLPNHMLLQISELLPREMQGILACCNPIPPLVRQNLTTLHQIVLKARDQSLVKPITEEEIRMRPAAQSWTKVNPESPLHCPHDLTRKQDFRDDLPTLLSCGRTASLYLNKHAAKLANSRPHITVFDLPSSSSESEDYGDGKMESSTSRKRKVNFVSPYERYKRMRPYVCEQEKQDEEIATQKAASEQKTKEITDEERIRQVKEHFMQESEKMAKSSKPFAEETKQPPPEPLRNQVSNKRKHVTSLSSQLNELTAKAQKAEPDVEKPSNSRRPAERSQLKKQRTQPLAKRNKTTEDFQPFDYSRVNFSRFQGGSSKPNETLPQTLKAKGKKRKYIGKTNHKNYTFGRR